MCVQRIRVVWWLAVSVATGILLRAMCLCGEYEEAKSVFQAALARDVVDVPILRQMMAVAQERADKPFIEQLHLQLEAVGAE